MSMEQPKFNPNNPEYKKVDDLPSNEQVNFIDFEDGFVQKEAIEAWGRWETEAIKANKENNSCLKIVNYSKQAIVDIAEVEARMINLEIDKQKKEKASFKGEIYELESTIKQWLCDIVPPMVGAINERYIEVVISEDSKGRLPADIIMRGINKIYAQKDLRPVELFPLPLYRGSKIKSEDVKQVIIDMYDKNEIRNVFLYVTEFISTGKTISIATNGIADAILELQEKFADAENLFCVMLPVIGGYDAYTESKKYKSESGEKKTILGLIESNNTYSERKNEIFKEYAGVNGSDVFREEFIEKMSDKFVEIFNREQNN